MAHNGYKNYATWCVNLWLDSDPQTQRWVEEAVRLYDEVTAAGMIEELVRVSNPIRTASNVYSDLLEHSLEQVDWDEIVRSQE